MLKVLFAFIAFMCSITCDAQDSTYIEMDYIGNQDKPVPSIFIYPENIMPEKIAEDSFGYAAFTETYAVAPHHYIAIAKFINDYSLSHPVKDTRVYPGYSYNIYIRSSDDRSVFLETKVPTREEAEVFFSQLVEVFNKEQMNADLRHYINRYILYRN